MKKLNVIIIHENTLISLGLAKIMNEMFNTKVTIEHNLNRSPNLEEFDLIFLSVNTFALYHAQLNGPKYKIILISDSHNTIDNIDNYISSQWSEEAIITQINNKINTLTEIKTAQNELSKREIEVLKLIVLGKLNKEIADELNISFNTVLTHRKNITSKLGIKSASGLSVYAMMNGLI